MEDFKINVRFKLSALWASVMFCYIYGDYFVLFVPGHIQSLINGESGLGETTPLKLLLFSILMTLPSIMVFLSLALSPKICRWANIVLGLFYTAIMILVGATSLGEWMIFYIYLAVIEIALTSVIVWHAWRWKQQDNTAVSEV
jgi:hypothetical protein